MYTRVLVPLDGSPFSEQALPRALNLAEHCAAALELVLVSNPSVPGQQPNTPGAIGEEALEHDRGPTNQYLEGVESRIRGGGFQGEVNREVLPAGNVAASLIRQASSRGADLIVMTTHGRSSMERAWLGSGADGVIRRSPVPVLLLRPGADTDAPPDLSVRPDPFSKILFPLDGSSHAEKLPDLAAPLADAAQVDAILLRVVPPLSRGGSPYDLAPGAAPYLPNAIFDPEQHKAAVAAAEEYLTQVAGALPFRETQTRVAIGDQPGVSVLKLAQEEGVDLIAMSTAGKGGIARLLLGSVADKVVRGSKVPVLVHRQPRDD